jgi:uncharacterized protein YaiL (DUF2058 family)
MSLSLRDQLLQAGLINEKQAQQARNQPRHERKVRAEKKPEVVDEKTLALRKAEAEKREKDMAANRALIEKVEQKAKRAEIRQLVDQHKLPKIQSDESYNFVSGKKIKRMPVDAARRAQLVSGALVIVNCDGNYEIVPGKIAERIRQRDPSIVLTHRADTPVVADPEDPYKDFVVLDDLLW